jgi:DNA-binding XRE family transcriptional regulator
MDQPALASMVGVCYQTIGHWENYRTKPDRFYVQKLAMALGVPFSKLSVDLDKDWETHERKLEAMD